MSRKAMPREEKLRRRREFYARNRDLMRVRLRASYEKNKPARLKGMLEYNRKKRGMPAPTRIEPPFCEICGNPPLKSDDRKIPARAHRRLCLDHCHVTGAFRGWICRPCNMLLGNARDNPETLRRAVAYLETFNMRRKLIESLL